MIRREYRFQYKIGDRFKLLCISDIHAGHSDASMTELKKTLDRYVDDERTIVWGNGDWFDSISVPDPRYLKESDQTITSAIINESIRDLRTVIEPYKERIIGIGIGNHEQTWLRRSGADPVGFLCEFLSTSTHTVHHLGMSALLRFVFSYGDDGNGGSNSRLIDIYQHHGWGSPGRTLGHSLTKYGKQVEYYAADLFFFGHDHRLCYYPLPPILSVARNLKWVQKPRRLIMTGSYLRSLNDSQYPNYVEEKGLPTIEIGSKCIEVRIMRDSIETRDVS